MSERRRDTATVHTKTAQAKCITGYKTQKKPKNQTKQNTANMHRQWKLTVNSQNRVAMIQPRYRTQTGYILTVSLQTHCPFWRGAQNLTSCILQNTQTRTVASAVTVTVRTPTRTDRNKA